MASSWASGRRGVALAGGGRRHGVHAGAADARRAHHETAAGARGLLDAHVAAGTGSQRVGAGGAVHGGSPGWTLRNDVRFGRASAAGRH